MIAIHFITNTFPPTEGGLEKRLLHLANHFMANGYKVFVHLCNADTEIEKYGSSVSSQIIINLIGITRARLDEPIRLSDLDDFKRNMEKLRLDTLIVTNLIADAVKTNREYDHVIISNYITTCGFLAMNVADALSIPHIASLVGTDFSRGFYNPLERYIIDKVIGSADCIVTLNDSFLNSIKKIPAKGRFFRIHSSVGNNIKMKKWSPKSGKGQITLFSDCGYCHKKGTSILLMSFYGLLGKGINARLIICGKTNKKEDKYWNDFKQEHLARLGDKVSFSDFLDEGEVVRNLTENDLYCYPTLSEGCSNSRMTALCIGIPMITTSSGEIIDLANTVSHVKTCIPGDPDQFKDLLYETCCSYLTGKITIDDCAIENLKKYLSAEREIANWKEVINYSIEK